MNVHAFSLPGSYLVIELANGCNLKCEHCAQSDASHPHYARTGYFPRPALQSLLEDLDVHRIRFDTLILFWLGEALLHPEFEAIYADLLPYCGDDRPFKRVEVHTNATTLSRRMAARILNRSPAPQRWHLTLDAATAATYRAVKGVDLFDRAEENVRRLIEFKGRGGFPRPQLILQYIIGEKNASEVGAFLARWESLLDRARLSHSRTAFHVPDDTEKTWLYLKSLDCPTPALQARANALYKKVVAGLGLAPRHTPEAGARIEAPEGHLARTLTTPCSAFWKSPVIGWDGMLTTCTRDSLGENALGNVLETPFSRLWFGEGRIARWREAVGKGNYDDLPLCRRCFIPRSVNYTGITRAEIASVENAA